IRRGLAVDPASELNAVTGHVHEHPAASQFRIPEPIRVRPVMLLRLPDQVDLSERTFVSKLFCPHILRREADLLGIHQLDPSATAAAIISSASRSVRASGFSQMTCFP